MARKTTEEFILEATEKHKGRYSYQLVDYKTSKDKVILACNDHGNFLMTPNNHLNGTGCLACKQVAMSKLFRKSTPKFIAQAKEVHGEKYDYSKTVYSQGLEPVTIVCRVHGDFSQMPNHHIAGSGCMQCGMQASGLLRSHSKDMFIEKARIVHGSSYEYSDVIYINSTSKVVITCKVHGNFSMQAQGHLAGQGCPKCGHGTILQDEFIQKAKEVHGTRYDYSEVAYNGVHQHVSILCHSHGLFKQIPYVHLRGSGCGSCGINGFDYNQRGTLYVMTCGDMTKVGITNKLTIDRAKRISGSFGSEFLIVKEFSFEDGQECSDIETKLLRLLKTKYSNPINKFDGYTESFLYVDRPWLYLEIDKLTANAGVLETEL